uniref:HTH_48 domain-containing protein n=1 Tax=Strongyloides papillosus TaxID=174720 RepID=A0A0N5BRD5_STREA
MPKEVKRKRTHTESNDGESNDDRENQICEVINSNSNNSSNPAEFTTNNPRKYGTSNFDKHLRNVHKLSIVQSKDKGGGKKDFDKKSIALNFIKINPCYRIFSNKWFKFFNDSLPSASTVQRYVKNLANEPYAKLQDGLEDYKFVLSFDGYKFQQRKMLSVV